MNGDESEFPLLSRDCSNPHTRNRSQHTQVVQVLVIDAAMGSTVSLRTGFDGRRKKQSAEQLLNTFASTQCTFTIY